MRNIKKPKIYLDTSVIGYLHQETQPEKMQDTLKLWEKIKQGEYEVVLSQLVFDEISRTRNEEIKEIMLGFIAEIDYKKIEVTEEVKKISDLVMQNHILTQKSIDDSLHIGCAIIAECDAIVSWNFKHLVNIRTINGVRAIATMCGYNNMNIVQPTMLIQEEDD
ncbi:MAG: PIN domain-containing protein [Oscillospiraceae bacterium]|nr:PIN domain-containing protein [Oscillospiraceae bacterium]